MEPFDRWIDQLLGVNAYSPEAKNAAQRERARLATLGAPQQFQNPYSGSDELENYEPPASALPQARAAQIGAPQTREPDVPPTVVQQSSAGGALPRTRAAATGGAPASPYAPLIAGYDKREADLQAQMEQHQQPADYSQMQDYARARGQTYLPMALSAALIGMGPRGSEGLGKLATERAHETVSPMKVEGGFIDAAGNAMIDPGFKRIQQMQFLQQRIEALDKVRQRAVTAQQHDAALAEQRALREQQLGIANADRAERTRLERAKLEQGKYDFKQDPNTGEWVAFNKNDPSKSVRISDATGGAFGGAAAGPGGLPPIGKLTESQAKAVNAGGRLAAGLPKLQAALAGGYEPGWTDVAWQATMGTPVSFLTSKVASDKGLEFFGTGRDILAALLRKESGAAINKEEWNQFAPLWLPWPSDSPQQRADKMERLENQFNLMQAEGGPQGANYIRAVRAQSAAPRQGAGGGGMPSPAAIDAELQRRSGGGR